jgi:hypothetical protein
MQTTRALNARTTSGSRVDRRKAIGANLLIAGTVCLLAAIALFILVSEPGAPASTPSRPASVVDSPAPSASIPGELDRSWLCLVGSDEGGPGTPTVVAEMFASQGIVCTRARGVDTEPGRAD